MDRVLVDRVGVIHIELHHRHDRGEFGDESVQNAQLVHPAQRPLGVAVIEQEIKEDADRLGILAQLAVDQVQVGRQEAHGIGMQKRAGPQPLFEDSQHIDGMFEEGLLIGHGQSVLPDRIGRARPFAAGKKPRQHRLGLGVIGLERGKENAGQLAHAGRVAEIVLHEEFDRPPPVMVAIARALGHLHLHIEGQLVHRAVGDHLQMTADRPEEILGVDEGGEFLRRKDAASDQFLCGADAVDVFGDPIHRLQIPQAALAFLDVRLDHIALAALLGMPRGTLLELSLDELGGGRFEKLVPKARA